MAEPLKGLRVEIIRSRYYSPSPGGASPSEHVTQATLIAIDGKPLPKDCQVFEPTIDAPAVLVEHVSSDYMRACFAQQRGGVMFSGAWIHDGDSRYREQTGTSYPIPLHDRQEW